MKRFFKLLLPLMTLTIGIVIASTNANSVEALDDVRLSIGQPSWKDAQSQEIITFEKLKLGRNWLVFSLNNYNYYGRAKVISRSGWTGCEFDNIKGTPISFLKLEKQSKAHSEENSFLLVYSEARDYSNAKIKRAKFEDMPQKVRLDFDNGIPKYSPNNDVRNVTTADLDLDQQIDVIVIYVEGRIPGGGFYKHLNIFSRQNSGWENRGKYRHTFYGGCG